MLTYLKRLTDERDSLTATVTGLAEGAARDERDLNDTERASVATMQTRCASIDEQLATYNAQAESTRAYAKLRGELAVVEDGAGDDRQIARRDGGVERRDVNTRADWGATFIRSGVLDGYPGSGRSNVVELPMEFRTAADAGGAAPAAAPAGPIKAGDLAGGLVAPYVFTPRQPTYTTPLLDLVAHERVTTGSVQWLYWLARDPEAGGPIAEGEVKPEADLPAEIRDSSLDTFAHYRRITRQALDDIPRLQSIIEGKLKNGLARRLEREIGDAVDGNAVIPSVEGESLLGAIRAAQGQIQSVGYNPTAVGLNPNDWATIDIDLLGRTLNGPTVNGNMWALRPVAVPSMPEGTAVVGDWEAGVTLFDRGVANVYLTDSHADLFIRNVLVVLAETRGKVVVNEPFALMKCTAAAATPGTRSGAAAKTATPAGS